MGETREIILEGARELFNTNGIERTSTREIARACSLSQGNLTYHFPRKSELVIALFRRLKEESDRVIAELGRRNFSLENLRAMVRGTLETQRRYRFLFLDFLNIIREIEPLRKEYAKLNRERREQFQGILALLGENGLLRRELGTEEVDSLFALYNIFFNSWLSDSEIQYRGRERDLIPYYESLALGLLAPYLTEEAVRS